MLYSSVVIRISFSNVSQIHTCTHTSSLLSHVCAWLALLCLLARCLPACCLLLQLNIGSLRNRTGPHTVYIQTECDSIRFHHTHKSFNHFPQAFSHGFLRILIQSKHALEVVGSPFFILLFFEFLFSHTEQHRPL